MKKKMRTCILLLHGNSFRKKKMERWEVFMKPVIIYIEIHLEMHIWFYCWCIN